MIKKHKQVKNGTAYYVTYPGYKAKSGIKTFGNKELTIPTGHAGVILSDANGNTRYYEYGRYADNDPHRVGVSSNNGKGIVRRYTIPNIKNGNVQPIINTLQKFETQNEGGNIQLTEIPDIDYNAAVKYVEDFARDPNRTSYSLVGCNGVNCGTFAHSVIQAGNENVGDGTNNDVFGNEIAVIRPVAFPNYYKSKGYNTKTYKKFGGIIKSLF